jgi:Na+-driven multidrug efflux pump
MALQVWTLVFLGHLGGEALYIRAVYTPVSFLVLAVTEGAAVASQVSAGIATRNERRDVLRPLSTYTAVSSGLLLLATVTFAAGQSVIFSVLGVDAADRHGAVTFVVAMCLASVVGLVPGMAGAMLRGMGRPGASSLLSAGSVALTIAAMIVCHAAAGLGMLAVPAGTAIAAAATSAASAVLLRGQLKHIPGVGLSRNDLRDLLTFGAPVSATFLMLSVVSSGYLRVLRNAGAVGVAGFNLGQNANSFFMVVAVAIGSGVAVAANLRQGEDRQPVLEAGLATTVQLALPAYAAIGTLAYLLRDPLAALLTSDKAVAVVGASYLMWMGPTFTVYGGTFALLTYLEQVGRASAAATLNAIYFAVILAIAFALPQPVSSTDLIRLLAVSNVVGFATCWLTARYLIHRSR